MSPVEAGRRPFPDGGSRSLVALVAVTRRPRKRPRAARARASTQNVLRQLTLNMSRSGNKFSNISGIGLRPYEEENE